jgi:hypothetical protein
MAAISLGETCALQFSVVAQDASGIGDIALVGILFEDRPTLKRDQEVAVFDVDPPLRLGASLGKLVAHAVGYLDAHAGVAPPTEEQKRIALWLAELQTRGVKCGYRVMPASRDTFDPHTRRAQYQSFSCAGLVASCYRDGARVPLLVEDARLPDVARALTARIWERPFAHLEPEARDTLMKRYGLEGEGPWKVLLPGYLLHALNQPRSALPYAPKPGDWQFR